MEAIANRVTQVAGQMQPQVRLLLWCTLRAGAASSRNSPTAALLSVLMKHVTARNKLRVLFNKV